MSTWGPGSLASFDDAGTGRPRDTSPDRFRPATTPPGPPRLPRRGRRPRRLPPRRAHLARLPVDARRDPPLVRHPGAARQHRPEPRLAPGRPLLHRRRALPGPGPLAPGGLPGRAPRADRGPRPGYPVTGHLAWPSDLPGRRLVVLDARHARAAGPLRHLGPGQARVQLPGGPDPGPLPRRHRDPAGGPRVAASGPRDGVRRG